MKLTIEHLEKIAIELNNGFIGEYSARVVGNILYAYYVDGLTLVKCAEVGTDGRVYGDDVRVVGRLELLTRKK